MRSRRFAWVMLAALPAVACTQVLGIEDRSLRPAVTDDDAGLTQTEGGVSVEASTSRGAVGAVSGNGDPPLAAFSAGSIDFGLVGCGTGAPSNRTLIIDNVGDAELDYQATLGPTSHFSIVGSSAGPIAAQSYATLTLSSDGFPSFATAGQTETTTLTIVTSAPGVPTLSRDFKLSETATGATLSLAPALAAFGQVQVGTSAGALPIALTNDGNVATTVMFGTSSDPQYSLTSDAGAMLLGPGESLSGLTAHFLPASAASSTSTVAIVASGGPMCGISPSELHLSGEGTSGPITVQPGSLDFGLVDCGAAASPKQITMTTTGSSFSWTAALGLGAASPYVVSPTSGTATAGVPVTITVTPKAVPSTSAITADFYADALTVTASDGPHVVPLHETAHGAVLAQTASSVAFGGANVGSHVSSSFNVVNDGNAAATVSYSVNNLGFAITPQGQVLGGQGYVSPTTVTFSPLLPVVYSSTATMTVPAGTVLCAALPSAIALSGTGTVTTVKVSPSSIDFGAVNCGSTATAKSVTITNTASSGSFNWTATLSKGASSPYQLSPTSGNLKATKFVTLTVSPVAIPQTSPVTSDYYADTLTITTDDPSDSAGHVVSLHETAQGVILALSPSTVPLGSVAFHGSASAPFQVTNSGNLRAHVTLALAPGGAPSFTVDPNNASAVDGQSAITGTATFAPTKAGVGAKSTTVTATFPDANCGGAVAPLTLTATGL